MDSNIVSFINKARDKGVELKKPPAKFTMNSRKLIEKDDEDVEVFQFETERDLITLRVYKTSKFFVFEFRDKETKSMYNKYEIDVETFYYMELALNRADDVLKDI